MDKETILKKVVEISYRQLLEYNHIIESDLKFPPKLDKEYERSMQIRNYVLKSKKKVTNSLP